MKEYGRKFYVLGGDTIILFNIYQEEISHMNR